MIDFDSLTKKDCEKFCIKLDLHVEFPKSLPRLQARLKDVHAEATAKLKKNNCRLRKQKQIQFTKQLLKENLAKLDADTMRYYAKRLGNKGKGQQRKILLSYLQDIIKKTKTQINVENINSDSDNDVVIDMHNDNADVHITAGCSDYDSDYVSDVQIRSSDPKEPIDIQNYEWDYHYIDEITGVDMYVLTNGMHVTVESYDREIYCQEDGENSVRDGADDDEDDEKGLYIIHEDIIMPSRPEQDTTNNGRIFYQTDYYTIQQLNRITKTKVKVKMLFGDNDTDNYRNTDTQRLYCGGQAKIMGHYDRTYAFGIITTFKKSPTPKLENFKKLMDKQFITVKNLLLEGYDIIIPTPTQKKIKKRNMICNKTIYHNLGTGSAKLELSYLLYIQHKIDQLKKYMKCKEITMIKSDQYIDLTSDKNY